MDIGLIVHSILFFGIPVVLAAVIMSFVANLVIAAVREYRQREQPCMSVHNEPWYCDEHRPKCEDD